MTDLKDIYRKRRANLATWMAMQSIGAVIFMDFENSRDCNVRYFCGHPSDAILAIGIDGSSVLIPWDENLAKKMAFIDTVIPYTRYQRQSLNAVAGALKTLKTPTKSRVEIPCSTPYPEFLHYVDYLSNYDIICRENGVASFTSSMRAIKDDYEITCIRSASSITDEIIDLIENNIKNESIKTESEIALLIENECRKRGCEGTGFETLVAGSSRSHYIHCFPAYTDNNFPGEGLSIIDFGVKYKGYTSDATITIAKGNLSEEQEKQLTLVNKAYSNALDLYKNKLSIKAAATKVDEIFTKAKKKMPHSLGHGIGLEAHENPVVRQRTTGDKVFLPNMVVTLEPGLYDPENGGCRLENDILITENGNEQLTHSRIIRV